MLATPCRFTEISIFYSLDAIRLSTSDMLINAVVEYLSTR